MITPFDNRIVLKAPKAEETTKSGIYVPDAAKEKPQYAEVVALGPNVKIELKAGDKVIFKEYSTTLVKEDSKEYLLIDESDVLAKVS